MALYPQKPPFTQAELVEFLNVSPLARLSTHNSDGTIHISPVYFKYIDGEIIIGTQVASCKVRNIKRNPQVTVLIDNQVPPWKGVLIYGEATLDDVDVVAKRAAIFERYTTPEEALKRAQYFCGNFESVVLHIIPRRITSFDYTKEGWLEQAAAKH